MNGLLDTHNFIWTNSNPDRLSPQSRDFIEDESNHLYLSIASVWEIQIKIQSGKLSLKYTLLETIRHQREANGIEILPISLPHIYEIRELPLHHRDPFDCVLIAQARIENLILLSVDDVFSQYSVPLLR